MSIKVLKLRVRRRVRRGQKQALTIGKETDKKIERNIISRLGRLLYVRRFVASWMILLLLLIGCVLVQTNSLKAYYEPLGPLPGGIYTEGILGDFTTANPIYSSNEVDSAVSRLVFAGLLTYNNQNQLVGDLAQSWSVTPSGKVYTVQLKPNLTWQDGKPLTSADVVFTYQTIQNPDAGSPLNQSWQNVTVSAAGPQTVVFTLSDPLTAFPYSLTNGIVPEHLLQNVPPDQLRSASFNTDPVGAGPFQWNSLAVQGDTPQTRQEQITLTPFKHYAGGAPKLDNFLVRAYHDQSLLVGDFKKGNINGIAGLDNVPSSLADQKNFYIYSLPLTAADMVFFKNSSGVLSDIKVRQALVRAADTNSIINGLGYPVVPVREPLLNGQVGYNPAYQQASYNQLAAAKLLQKDGWILASDGLRYKNGQPLTFSLFASNDQDDTYVTNALKHYWRAVGADVNVELQNDTELQSSIAFRSYDALLYGISIGVDPDVFVYWDRSQANPALTGSLNFSAYSSVRASLSLEAGRTRSGDLLRSIKYRPFLQEWQQDAPALGLYQPRFLYLTHEQIYGLSQHTINEATDRFNNVQNWETHFGRSAN